MVFNCESPYIRWAYPRGGAPYDKVIQGGGVMVNTLFFRVFKLIKNLPFYKMTTLCIPLL